MRIIRRTSYKSIVFFAIMANEHDVKEQLIICNSGNGINLTFYLNGIDNVVCVGTNLSGTKDLSSLNLFIQPKWSDQRI